ncbi:MAG TPA: RDD family protein [Acidimicrobiales bacterium]|nr:RDD family protein [Acidimicrobiales bacterium]
MPPPAQGFSVGPQNLPPGVSAGQLSEWPQRAIGWLIDFVPFLVVGIIALIVGAVISTVLQYLFDLINIALGIFFAYQVGTFGSTPGMRVAGLKCVSVKTGQPLGFGMAFVRALIHAIAFALCLIPGIVDMLFPLWDAQKQTLADKLVSSMVVNVPKGPFEIMPKTS